MTPLVPLMLFGWVPLTIIFFLNLKPHNAVLFSVIGGWLFLPTASYDFPGIPAFTKNMAIALGLILGGRLSGHRRAASFKWTLYDVPMILWCFFPIVTSLSNGLGIYDGLSVSFNQFIIWGAPYLAARIYFDNTEKLHELCLGIIIGGLLYLPLCLYEIRMSPRLNLIFYGYFPHDWYQHKRYGGWRPIVFMKHGLMVALWMASAFISSFWLWRSRKLERLKGIPLSFLVTALITTTILCKSANGWFAAFIGCCCYYMYSRSRTNFPFLLLLLGVPVYIGGRISGCVSGHFIEFLAGLIVDAERVGSLSLRLLQEDLFIHKTMDNFLFGWGGYSRGWPVDPITGELTIRYIDSLWLISFNKFGFLGMISFISSLLMGPWLVFRSNGKIIEGANMPNLIPGVLGLVVVLFMIDCLFNGMANPVYIIISGALVSWYLNYNSFKGNQLKP